LLATVIAAYTSEMSDRDMEWLHAPAHQIAPLLLGCELIRSFAEGQVRVRIVETEAYDQYDAASHSFAGQTRRNAVMFGPAGFLYVYFTYGMHYCCNVVTGNLHEGQAVLIRAVQPLDGLGLLQAHRTGVSELSLTNGPAKLCQAMGIDKQLNGHDLRHPPLQLRKILLNVNETITTTTRIGIRKAIEQPMRFYISSNPYVS
jgi:DNA-3-methyladenine glycosylase